ncbi:NUDIX domain-containing protein [Meiothermus sp. QL-1]|uniref:NUDIX domain-containing protein n=1 Tax=Meiothermus sp. QL-1 TaxID=2058095 RepID=UPI000E0A7A5A|nr:NUDIX domain-containing protein [Meiothermus sp. QL-1]RDI96374.1 NUDIX domain-containing protein [Meiothermus sp. QL-1]
MEQVYVLPAWAFPPAENRLIPLQATLLERLRREGFFLVRDLAEEDPRYRQLIPYALVRYRGRYLLMRRKGGGESRLRGQYTLGVGGHINPGDGDDPLAEGLRRELWEEVGVGRYQARPVGLIVMSDTPVSRVHAGVAFVVEAGVEPRVREVDKLEGRLVGLPELFSVRGCLEGWSRLLLDWLEANQPL